MEVVDEGGTARLRDERGRHPCAHHLLSARQVVGDELELVTDEALDTASVRVAQLRRLLDDPLEHGP